MQKEWTGNELKILALASMTLDHLLWVLFPDYPTNGWLLLGHILGRLAAPIFWFMVAEGYYHTRSRKKYAKRLLLLAIVSHFAYNFAFGHPMIPFRTGLFNQTSVAWPLFLGVIALWICQDSHWKTWQKNITVIGLTILAFPSDWSSIAVLAIADIGQHRGDFKQQMTRMMGWVAVYAAVYAVFLDPLYGALQLFVALSIPLLHGYHGKRGGGKHGKMPLYLYYPLHLVLCGCVRLWLTGG